MLGKWIEAKAMNANIVPSNAPLLLGASLDYAASGITMWPSIVRKSERASKFRNRSSRANEVRVFGLKNKGWNSLCSNSW